MLCQFLRVAGTRGGGHGGAFWLFRRGIREEEMGVQQNWWARREWGDENSGITQLTLVHEPLRGNVGGMSAGGACARREKAPKLKCEEQLARGRGARDYGQKCITSIQRESGSENMAGRARAQTAKHHPSGSLRNARHRSIAQVKSLAI